MRRRVWIGGAIAFLLVVVVALGLLGVGPLTPVFHRPIDAADHGGIARLQLQPVPEGVQAPPFERRPSSEGARPLSLVAEYIPDPLPAPLYQGPTCHPGGDLIVTFADGYTVTYGPCRRPPLINRLWAGMIYVLDDGKCAPNCGPGGLPGP
jgi:hypothetical protein